MRIASRAQAPLATLAAFVLAGCAAGAASPTPLPTPGTSAGATAAGAASPTAPPPAVASAAATPASAATVIFKPPFTYTAPAGWRDTDEKAWLLRLLPKGATNDDFDAGSTEGIDVVTGVRADLPDCSDQPDPNVGADPAAIATALAGRAGLIVTKKTATVGGLSGFVLDIRLAKGWTKACQDGIVAVPLIDGPTNYDQRMGASGMFRFYLLDLAGSSVDQPGTLAIQLYDPTGGTNLDSLSAIVSTFAFTKS